MKAIDYALIFIAWTFITFPVASIVYNHYANKEKRKMIPIERHIARYFFIPLWIMTMIVICIAFLIVKQKEGFRGKLHDIKELWKFYIKTHTGIEYKEEDLWKKK